MANITGTNGNDTLTGTSGNDTILGLGGDDDLFGVNGNDTINGGEGNNSLHGGLGNDTYIFDSTGDDIIDEADASVKGSGIDTIKIIGDARTTINLVDYDNVENLDASGATDATDLSGNDLANVITGSNFDDSIDDSGLGADTLIGGKGDDTYTVDSYLDKVTELANSKTIDYGFDTLTLAETFDFGKTTTYTMANNVEELDLSDLVLTETQQKAFTKTKLTINGNASNNEITVSEDATSADFIKILAGAGNDLVNGGLGADYIDGGVGDDTILGGAGNDNLLGGVGNDYVEDTQGSNALDGGAGNDTYFFEGATATTIKDASGIDTIKAIASDVSLANYTMIENIDASTSIADELTYTGNALNNTIYAGTGADNELVGSLGNDTYILKSDNNIITEVDSSVKNSGIDTVKLTADYDQTAFELAENIEILDGSGVSSGISLIGNQSVNTISGGNGADIINGGLGADIMVGGKGDDIYVVDNALDKITEAADTKTVNYGNDTVLVAEHVNFGPVSGAYNLYANVENIDFRDLILDAQQQETFAKKPLLMNGNALNNTIFLNDNFGQFMKTYAGNGNDTIYGGSANDYIDGGAGDDTILGGGGTNSLFGGAGNDIYQVDGSGTDIVNDASGIDTIDLFDTGALLDGDSFSMANYKGVENLDASAMNLDGMILSGNDSDNIITGTDGDDTISGGKGKNTLQGGLGDDTYLLDGSEKSTTIVDADGNNQLQLVVDANHKFGGLNAATISMASFQGINSIDASQISATNMTIIGNAANNTLTGAAGTSTLDGAAGDDIYMVSGLETSLTINDSSGNDTIRLIADEDDEFAGGNTYSIATNTTVENIDASLIMSGMTLDGNNLDNTIIGGIGNDTLSGGLGSNSLEGGEGNDTYLIDGNETATNITDTDGTDTIKLVASAGAFAGNSSVSLADYTSVEVLNASDINTTNLILSGNDLDNTIIGGSGNDNLFGGLGENSLVGGAGNDTYLIDGNETATNITDTDGTDTIKLVASGGAFAGDPTISLMDYNSVENLDASAITNTDLTLSGNDLNNTINGGAGDDTINGNWGNDTLYGNGGNDTLYGNELDGDKTLVGGSGDDTYLVNNILDKIIEVENEGIDTLKASSFVTGTIDLSLNQDYANIDNLDASASENDLLLIGNLLNNTITGGSGNDFLDGWSGIDKLIGGIGNDTYILNTDNTIVEEEHAGVDTIRLGTFFGDTVDLSTTYLNVENIDASLSSGTDLTLTGNDLNNTIWGGEGNDYISAGTGNDSLYGNDGNDTFTGSTGLKTYFGGDGDDVYLYNGVEDSVSFVEEANEGNDTIVLNSTGKFEGLNDYSLSLGFNNVENLDGSLVNGTNLTLGGNELDNIIKGGAGNDNISGGIGNDTLYGGLGSNALLGGAGDDTYFISGEETSTTITETSGNDTIALYNTASPDGRGAFAGGTDYSIVSRTTIENIDASLITSDITLTGNDNDNSLLGGSGNDTIFSEFNNTPPVGPDEEPPGEPGWTPSNDYLFGGAGNDNINGGAGNDTLVGGIGNDTLWGADGNDTFSFFEGDQKDTILSTSASDLITIDTATGVSTSDMMFYKDTTGALYIDYTDDAVGADVAKISAGNYNSATVIQVGNSTISINTISQYLAGSGSAFANLDAAGINALTTGSEATQVAALVSAWTTT